MRVSRVLFPSPLTGDGVGGCGGVSVVYVVGGSGCGWVWMDVWVCRGGWGGTGHDNVITCSEISSLKTRN